jgi:hypothetical protein
VDLSYPPALRDSLERIGKALAEISVKDEMAAAGQPELWQTRPSRNGHATPAASPLAQVAEFRALGAYALPLPELLARAGRGYVPLPGNAGGAVALGWPDASSPWLPSQPLTVSLSGGKLSGTVSVAPFCVPATGIVFLAQTGSDVALVDFPSPPAAGEATQRAGDAFVIELENAPADVLAEGPEALKAWDRAVEWERLALTGLTAGLMDRAWRIALDAVCEGKRQGNVLADEQVAQFQLADNDIERLSAEHLILDLAVDAEKGKPVKDKLAMVRYYTSKQAEGCAARALHVAQLFLPRMVPVARWLTLRAQHLSVFGLAREHEVRLAAAGLVAGMSLE